MRISRRLITAARGSARLVGQQDRVHRAEARGRRRWRDRACSLAAGAACLLAFGVPGVSQSPALASPSSILNWTKQAPATSPPARGYVSMAYDTATGTAVLFGGDVNGQGVGDTWTWNGSTWTKQAPTTSPPARSGASMAYDASTGTVVLFGGYRWFGDTWTWNGTTWTKQAPATSPAARGYASMAYDVATGTVVLFGGTNGYRWFADTWTWNGTTWTKQAPPISPSARQGASTAYDAATGTVVLFGGSNAPQGRIFGDTWTWNGTSWTKQAPANRPAGREGGSAAYDAATGTVVLFGGQSGNYPLRGTETWDGSTWTKQAPANRPAAREGAAMAYDSATGTVFLFGGYDYWQNQLLSDTWEWGSS